MAMNAHSESRRIPALGLCVLVLWGCAHAPVGSPPLEREVREQVGQLGVAYQGPASLSVQTKPVRGAAEGAGLGAKTAFGGTLAIAMSGGDPRGAMALIMLSPAIIAVGALAGAAIAPSADAVTEAEAALDLATADPTVIARVRNRMMERVQQRWVSAVAILPEADRSAEDEYLTQALQARQSVDTVLEVEGPFIVLEKAESAGAINPALHLCVSMHTRLRRAADRATLYAFTPEYRGAARTFTAWGANDAQRFRDELAEAADALADLLMGQLDPKNQE